jgi:UDP-glucose 4-epimerase
MHTSAAILLCNTHTAGTTTYDKSAQAKAAAELGKGQSATAKEAVKSKARQKKEQVKAKVKSKIPGVARDAADPVTGTGKTDVRGVP